MSMLRAPLPSEVYLGIFQRSIDVAGLMLEMCCVLLGRKDCQPAFTVLLFQCSKEKDMSVAYVLL